MWRRDDERTDPRLITDITRIWHTLNLRYEDEIFRSLLGLNTQVLGTLQQSLFL